MPLSWNEIRIRAAQFSERWKDETSEQSAKQSFWDEFFAVFGIDRKTVGLYEKAVDKLSGHKGFIDLFWPGMLIVEHKSLGEPLDSAFTQATDYALTLPSSQHPRYIIVSDFRTVRLYDLQTVGKKDMWQFSLKDLSKNVDKFSFIAGYEKQEIVEEDPVNRKAAERLAELHDQLKATGYSGHDLEVLLVRLLFCLFAEDSGIFNKGQFSNFMYDRTSIDGSDLGAQLNSLFEVLNTSKDIRQTSLDETFAAFPYVNGKLFSERIAPASFDHKMWDSLAKASHDINWSEISPAIFGAMFQGVMDPQRRRSLGAHYTSEQNILKVIKPLFLDDLWSEFEEVKDRRPELIVFQEKLSKLTFMDPACGCGNFLVVSYRELRKLEFAALKIIYGGIGAEIDLKTIVKCNVDQFYGIEIEEFPAQIAQVALWLTDAQMNNETSDYFGKPLIRLPLTHSPTIIQKDALELDWNDLISSTKLDYLFGNPPFGGKQLQSEQQKEQIINLFKDVKGSGNLDFVTGWYSKAVKYIQETKIKVAFVSTNSITQGEQVSVLWPHLLEYGIKINFAHRTFRWGNDAKGSAGVYCVIIGFWLKDAQKKWLFDYADVGGESHVLLAKNINPYLVDAPNIVVIARTKPISNVPDMSWGSKPVDNGNFMLDDQEKETIKDPIAIKYIHPLVSAKEFLSGERRWCFWLKDASPADIHSSKVLLERVERVRNFRLASKKKPTQEAAKLPALFAEIRQPVSDYIVVPLTTSENRRYVPLGLFDKSFIVNNSVSFLPDVQLYHFGVLESEMHMTWMRYVCGRLEGRYRYSNTLVYNTFVWPEANREQQNEISRLAQGVLDNRENYSDSSLAELYDPLTMPVDLLKAHHALDAAVDKLYRPEKFDSDTNRMQFLLEEYKKYSHSN